MPNIPLPGVALLSAYRKGDQLENFARRLVELNWRLIASAGTKRFLDEKKIANVGVADYVGEPMLEHRVVTLHPKIHGPLLARLDKQSHLDELHARALEATSLVYVDLYPLVDELQKPNSTIESVREMIDIGGPAMLRSGSKGERIVVSDPSQFDSVLAAVASEGGSAVDQRFLARLAAAAELLAANYSGYASEFYLSVADDTFPARFRKLATAAA